VRRDELPPELAHMPWDERRQLPIPHIVERPGGIANFGVLDPRRARDCYAGRLCAMCGLKMGAEVTLYGDVASLEPDGFYIEAPIHERCAEIALIWPPPPDTTGGLCPFISRESWPRRRQDDPQVAVLGDREMLRTIGRTVAKRPSILAIANSYQMAMMITEDTGQMPVYLAPDVVRVRRFGWADGVAREVLPEPEPVREVTIIRVQPRRLSRSKRRS
jgi:hypothetical protein